MKYKTSFPLSSFTTLNSMMSNFFSEYTITGRGDVIGSSLVPYVRFIMKLDNAEDHMHGDVIEVVKDCIIPPNLTRTNVNILKKTKTIVRRGIDSDPQFIALDKQPEEEITNLFDDASINAKYGIENTYTIPRIDPGVDYDSLLSTFGYTDIKYDVLSKIDALMVDAIPIDVISLKGSFAESSTFDITDPNDEFNSIIVSRELFPQYSKIIELSWVSNIISEDGSTRSGIIESVYPNGNMYTILKYLYISDE